MIGITSYTFFWIRYGERLDNLREPQEVKTDATILIAWMIGIFFEDYIRIVSDGFSLRLTDLPTGIC